jgi:hypothetical protein
LPEATVATTGNIFAIILQVELALIYITDPAKKVQYGHSWTRATVEVQRAQDCAGRNPHEELDQYLAAPLEDVDDVVRWWGVSTSLHCLTHQSPD